MATTDASAKIADKKPITDYIYEMYKSSLRSGQICIYLKYASMLVCIHDNDRAVTLLKDIESMITSDMVQISMLPEKKCVKPVIDRAQSLAPHEIAKILAAKIIMNVEFTTLEMNCAPSHLMYEMYKILTEDDDRVRCNKISKEIAVIDAKPFLYYLQYLAHEETEGKYSSKIKLFNYIESLDIRPVGLFDTAYNLKGHIFELENEASKTWQAYVTSATLVPRNNAAYWHMCRLFSQYVADKSPYERTK
ncbi:hypothetical protein DPMN_097447 [Dreissena polymorpha]|uniref:Uncharacterized protein n=2 Tax=Dreissena polymorpha TaxID=45954 RepID=A0A9D4LAJ7_DREPO|nr:hypothetical protein DPMN_097447 [Dreissena polymorpha]